MKGSGLVTRMNSRFSVTLVSPFVTFVLAFPRVFRNGMFTT